MAIALASSNILHFLPTSSEPPYDLLQTHPCLALLSKCTSIRYLKQVHSQFIKFGLHNTQFALSKLVEFCALSPYGDLSCALSIFNSVHDPNRVMYNMIIRGYSLSSSPFLALHYYVNMLLFGLQPNSYTFPFLLKSCTKLRVACVGKQVHGHVFKLGLENDIFVHTSLVNMYAQQGKLDDARLVFDKSDFRDAVSFTALITGYVLGGRVDDARDLFDAIPVRDVVSWNAMISGYMQTGRFDEALTLFQEMKEVKVTPDVSTLLSVLSACAHLGAIDIGNYIRYWIEEHGLGSNLRLTNALIDMYAKCGNLKLAETLFEGMQEKNIVSWNVIIGGYTYTSNYKGAMRIFRLMQRNNIEPNDVTFLNLIPACAQLGSLDVGKWIHAYIGRHYSDFPNDSLWTSLINMYAKSGNIEAAKQIFYGMETKNLASWNVMISGLAMHGLANSHSRFSLKCGMKDSNLMTSLLSVCYLLVVMLA